MSVSGPFVRRHPPAWPLAGAGGDDGGDPFGRRLMSTHEADLEPINKRELQYVCEACMLAFTSLDAVKTHLQGNRPGMFVRMQFLPRRGYVFVECLTTAQVDAAIRAYQQGSSY